MKIRSFILVFALYLSQPVIPQNFQNICTQGETYFKNLASKIRGFRMDSVMIQGNNDTMFFSFRAVRDTAGPYSSECLDVGNGYVLGRKILKLHYGWFCLFNSLQDTIWINTQAGINQFWKFCNLENGYIQAKVTSISTESVLGTSDQVKTITLQAKNNSGADIPSVFNQQYIKLSQHYGLTRIYDIYLVPYDTVIYTLCGKTHPQMGLSNLSWPKVYDFDTGDIFHYVYEQIYTGSIVKYIYTINQVLTKTLNADSTVDYTVKHCTRTETGSGTTYSSDTIVLHFDFNQLAGDTSLNFMPGEFFPTGTSGSVAQGFDQYFAFGGRNTKWIVDYEYIRYSGDTCWREYMFEWSGQILEYSEGIGKTYDKYYIYEYMGGDGEITSLVYYKKGSQEWGTPVASSCSTLLGINSGERENSSSVRVFPNPIHDKSRIILPEAASQGEHEILIYDHFGRIVLRQYFNGNTFNLEKGDLTSGIYLIAILSQDGELKYKTRVLFK